MLNVLIVIVVLAAIVLILLGIDALWKVFVTAGKPGWAVLVPGYNEFTMARIAKKPNWLVGLFTFLGIASFASYVVAQILKQPIYDVISTAAGILLFGFSIYIVVGMSRQFRGVTKTFWVFYILLPFLCLIELKKLKYKTK